MQIFGSLQSSGLRRELDYSSPGQTGHSAKPKCRFRQVYDMGLNREPTHHAC